MPRRITHNLSTPKTTALGGLLFLLPLAVVGALLFYVYRSAVAIYQVLKPWIPYDSAIGQLVLFGLAVALLLVLCFLAGVVAQRAIGRHFSRTVEQQLMRVYPKYGIYKELLAGTLAGDQHAPALQPILVQKEGAQAIAFAAERLADGRVVVYFPGAPDPWNGAVALVAPERVQPLELTLKDALAICERLGRDSRSLWEQTPDA